MHEQDVAQIEMVAPHAGAWIETLLTALTVL